MPRAYVNENLAGRCKDVHDLVYGYFTAIRMIFLLV
jgi:hypothetical protein